mmetsp:Transcript_14525/g.61352  ORF Transcript_14525/g.61352 Transcript_14525/m.61352 type:complete len:217 (-) Transcript_14525:578-1228(-)
MPNANWLSSPRFRTSRIKSHGLPLRAEPKAPAECDISIDDRPSPPARAASFLAITATLSRSSASELGRTVAYSTRSSALGRSGSPVDLRRRASTSGRDAPRTCHASHANDSTANWYSPSASAVGASSAGTSGPPPAHSREVSDADEDNLAAPRASAFRAASAQRSDASASPASAAWNATHASTASFAMRGASSLASENFSAASANGNESTRSISAT